MKIAKDTPLAEITLRKYERPFATENKREVIRRLCLSVGLLQPGDSRDVIVDVLYVLLVKQAEMSAESIVEEVIKVRKEAKAPPIGIAPSNIRRQIKRLRDLYLVEKVKNNYRIHENEKLGKIFEEKIEKFLLPSIVSRVKEYFSML